MEHTSDPALLARVRNCARCGGDHDGIEWRLLTRPIIENDAIVGRIEWNQWCPCPTNGEPILQAELPPATARAWQAAADDPPVHT
jgi:hypothetical protein